MTVLWPAIAAVAPEPPDAQLSPALDNAVNAEKQKMSWFVKVINADAYREFLRDLVALIDRKMQTAGYPPFVNPMMDRPFHVTVANDQGGDPMGSVSDLHRTPNVCPL